MLTNLEVYNVDLAGAPLLPLSTDGIEADPIQVRGITGLEPVKATVNTTPFSSADGESHNGNLVGKRNIVITVGFNPDWATQTVDSLRDILYTYFMPKNKVALRFFDTVRVPREIQGWVESCVPVLFSKDPEMQISIICPQPYFTDAEATVVEGDVKYSSAGDIADGLFPHLEGTEIVHGEMIPVGFKVTINAGLVPTYDDLLIIGLVWDISEVVRFDAVIDATHSVVYSSVPGEKYLRQVSDEGARVNLLGTVIGDPKWLQLQRGSSLFCVAGTEEGQTWTLEYYARYGGL